MLLTPDLPQGAGCTVTVGTGDADYATIAAAYADGKKNVCVITDVTETTAISIASDQLRISVNPDVSITNTIAAAAAWFTGATGL